jgi:1-aminocyclopropane-1-carboxylate deaminase/D-cysteine desulfhydrase-like pyridoxal-dependent ACC family enzyme
MSSSSPEPSAAALQKECDSLLNLGAPHKTHARSLATVAIKQQRIITLLSLTNKASEQNSKAAENVSKLEELGALVSKVATDEDDLKVVSALAEVHIKEAALTSVVRNKLSRQIDAVRCSAVHEIQLI